MDTTLSQQRDIRLRGRVTPHLLIHRRRDRQRSGAREAQRGEQIVRQAVREARQEIGTRRCDEHQVGPARQLDVAHGRLGRGIPQIGAHRAARQRLKCGRRDEFAGGGRHDHLDLGTALDQTAHQIGGFIGRDASGDTQQNAFALHAADYRPFGAFAHDMTIARAVHSAADQRTVYVRGGRGGHMALHIQEIEFSRE